MMCPVQERVTAMLSPVRHTDELVAVVPDSSFSRSTPAVAVRLTPADFKDIPYTPSFLLPASFDETIMADTIYHTACHEGFSSYFEEMYTEENEQELFVEHGYSRSEVIAEVVESAKMDRHLTSLAWRAGYMHGWLSALALTDLPLAHVGMQVLTHIVTLEQGRQALGMLTWNQRA